MQVELCQRMGYRKIGLAFCWGLRKAAKIPDGILRRAGLEAVSVICKTGGVSKASCGIAHQVHPGEFEATPLPMRLNQQETEFNIVFGLFCRYAQALVTTLAVKDRVLAHNPVGVRYCADGYYKNKR